MASITNTSQAPITRTDHFMLWFCRHWVFIVSLILGLYVITPFLAPVFMSIGLTIPGKAIYWIYSFFCHQLPERSYFLFGPQISYPLPEIRSVWKDTNNIAIIRQFVGNPQMGWKVAWSDRMVSMYTSLWVFGIIWSGFRKQIKPLRWQGLILFLLPMAVDGTTHMISDLAGIGQGFRDSNVWLAILTNHHFAATFYAGDAWGSFNAWMRVISGALFGMGIVWFGFPVLNEAFINSVEVVEYKIQYRGWLQREKQRLSTYLTRDISQPGGLVNSTQTEQEGKHDDK